MKKKIYFNYKKTRYIILNCPKKAKVFAILATLDINNIEDINYGKKSLFSKTRKRA